MSLLMQALRKAERARVQNGHEPEPAEPPPPPVEGGPAFAVMPDGLRLEPLDAEPPVVPAQEAVHDPVPPQARHEPHRAPFTAEDAARDWQGSERPGMARPHIGERSEMNERGETAVRAGRQAPLAPRAIASSQRRLMGLVAVLLGLLLVFGFVYWRAMYGPGPGARLPMVPMPAPGMPPAASGGVQPTGIPVSPPLSAPAVAEGAVAGAGAAALYAPGIAAAEAPRAIGLAPAGSTPAAPATRPDVDVTIPTPEQLAAITDPAIRAEAMRDAAERAARQVRHDVSPAPQAPVDVQPVPPAASRAATASTPGVQRSAGAAPPTAANRQRSSARAGAIASPASRGQANSGGRALQTAVGENGDVRFVRGAEPNGIAPAVQNGYDALKTGDLATARQQYDLALLQDPNNRDALLGAAALALREGDGRQASNNYLRLLELDPSDPDALAGLSELRNGDLEANEIKLKGVARKHPDSGPVQFALGNLFARQGRWPEAQQSYFRAYSAMPDNADYAYNLGVGLDRMNQPRLAQTYYRRALELAQGSPPAFNVEAVRKRLQALESPPQ